MMRGISALPFVTCALFLSFPLAALAETIDPFTAPQGPFTVGPGEEISEEEAVVQSGSVLGGFRVMLPGVDEDAQGGSTASLSIGGGTMDCSAEFPGPGEDNNAFCSGGYDRGEGPTFDLTGSSEFRFDVQTVEGTVFLGVTLVDTNEEISLNLFPILSPGQFSIPFASLLSPTSPDGVDFTLIDNIAFAVIYAEGQAGRIVLSEFSTDGPIGGGPVIPVDDDIVAEEIPGTYYNLARDGEGCNLTQERDQVNMVLTCYFYRDGEQFWVIGVGELVDGQIVFAELTITSGAQYGDDFDPADVLRTNWGSGIMTWSDCNNAELELVPIVPGYEAITLEFTRIVPTTCGGGGVQGEEALWMGAFYNVLRDGEGFHFGVEAGGIFVMTWYTYLNGKQVWLIGTGTRDGNRVVFSDMVITYGADFGSEFDPADVVREPFGEITVEFSDCNNFTATVDSIKPEFADIVLAMTKIVPGACN